MILPSDQSGFRQQSDKSGGFNFREGAVYWVEHPKFGTIKSWLVLLSGDKLLFALETAILVPFPNGGSAVSSVLPVTNHGGKFTSPMTENDPWTIYNQEPAVKLPTK